MQKNKLAHEQNAHPGDADYSLIIDRHTHTRTFAYTHEVSHTCIHTLAYTHLITHTCIHTLAYTHGVTHVYEHIHLHTH